MKKKKKKKKKKEKKKKKKKKIKCKNNNIIRNLQDHFQTCPYRLVAYLKFSVILYIYKINIIK